MATAPDVIHQAAAIPVSQGRVCLVTSRSGKRWVVPKGCMEPQKTRKQIALQEAWEEAGLVGQLNPEPVGTYSYEKYGRTCLVTVFLMHVTEILTDWPERTQRQRRWFRPAKAQGRIEEAGLKKILHEVLEVQSVELPS